jgi:hypothetical protein
MIDTKLWLISGISLNTAPGCKFAAIKWIPHCSGGYGAFAELQCRIRIRAQRAEPPHPELDANSTAPFLGTVVGN